MRTAKANVSAASRAALAGALAGILLFGMETRVGAQLTSGPEVTAGYVVFPKIVADANGTLGLPTDTYLQLTNSNLLLDAAVECTWIDATGRCGPATSSLCPTGPGRPCFDNADCAQFPGQVCIPCWFERDFTVLLTPGQPIAFTASEGQTDLPCFPLSLDPLVLPPGCAGPNFGGILPAGQIFQGELKCVQVTDFEDPGAVGTPAGRNDLKGEATIISADGTVLTSAAYNAYGFRTGEGDGTSNGPLCLSPPLASPCGESCAKTYGGCPGILVLDHFFEGARIFFGDVPSFVRTHLTLTPCTELIFSGDDITDQVSTAAQMLVFNEFEQRFSTSTRVQCYKDIPLADIDTRPGPADDGFSVFSVAVQGTLVGQTRIRGVAGQETTIGHGLIGVAQEFYRGPAIDGPLVDTTAFNLHGIGSRLQGDAVCR